MKNFCLAFFNAYSQGISGGDQLFLLDIKKYKNKTIVTSSLGQKLCQSRNIKARFIITTKEKEFSSPIVTYLIRTVLAIIKTRQLKPKYLLSSSDFLPDSLPAFFHKIKNHQSYWIQKIYHLIPTSRKISHLAQILSFYFINKKIDQIIVDNPLLKKELIKKYHFSSQKIITQTPKINSQAIKATPPFGQRYTAIFVGQLRKSKGIFDLVDIWKAIVKKKPKATLAIIGKDINSNQEKLNNLISKNQLKKNVHLLGFLPSKQIYGLIKKSGLVLLPSYEEGYGMIIDEALLCQAQTIVYKLPIFQFRFQKNNKVIQITTGDKKQFTQKILQSIK